MDFGLDCWVSVAAPTRATLCAPWIPSAPRHKEDAANPQELAVFPMPPAQRGDATVSWEIRTSRVSAFPRTTLDRRVMTHRRAAGAQRRGPPPVPRAKGLPPLRKARLRARSRRAAAANRVDPRRRVRRARPGTGSRRTCGRTARRRSIAPSCVRRWLTLHLWSPSATGARGSFVKILSWIAPTRARAPPRIA